MGGEGDPTARDELVEMQCSENSHKHLKVQLKVVLLRRASVLEANVISASAKFVNIGKNCRDGTR